MPMGVDSLHCLPPNPKRGFVAGLVALPSVPYGQSHQLITSRGMVNLANFRFTLKKIKSQQPMELPVLLSPGSVLLLDCSLVYMRKKKVHFGGF